jgi:hypothetical protein
LSGDIGGVVIGGRLAGSEKPLLLSLLCKSNDKAKAVIGRLVSHDSTLDSRFVRVPRDPQRSQLASFSHKHALWVCEPSFGNKTEMGSLAGAAYLLNINAGVLRRAQSGQKPDVAHKGKSSLDLRLSVLVENVKAWPAIL